MPTSSELALQQRCQQIVTSPVLSPEQKRHFLALEAENALPYPQLPAQARQALDDGVICDMYEGHARSNRATFYPITRVFWPMVHRGWSWKAQTILMMRYPYSPSCTTTFRP